MAARRKANVLGSRNMNSAKSLPTILSRKRKNEEDEMQTVGFDISNLEKFYSTILFVQDINSYLNNTSNLDHSENLQGVSFANIQLSRPNSRWDFPTIATCIELNPCFCSRVPLATITSKSENIVSAESSPDLSYAVKLPDSTNTPFSPLSSSVSPNSQKSRRKQTLSWKKPRMRDSWSQ